MSSIDNRIVSMKFNNAQFNAGIKNTNNALADLKEGLKLDGAENGLSRVGEAAKDLKLDNISGNVEKVASKFNWLSVVGATALVKLTNTAMATGASMLKGLVDPIVEGGKARAISMAQAKFQFRGLKMDIDSTMASALAAVKGTAFGLDEAAVAAASFGASGVSAGDDMTSALTGISGVAAMTSSSYTDVARIFTTVAGNGRLMGDQLNQLGARGLNAAAAIATSMGISEEAVRKMVSRGEIDFNTFARIMDETFGEHAKSASDLYTGALSNMQVALKRIGAYYFEDKLERQRVLFLALTKVIDVLATAFEPLLDAWAKIQKIKNDRLVGFLEGLGKYFDSISIAGLNFARTLTYLWEALESVTNPIKKAFKEIFPASEKAGEGLVNFSRKIRDFAKGLIIGEEGAARITWAFKHIFTGLKFGKDIIANVLRVIFNFLGGLGQVAGAVLKLFGPIIDFFRAILPNAKDAENGISGLADKIIDLQSRGLKPLLAWLERIRIKFDNFINQGKAVEYMRNGFEHIKNAGKSIVDVWQKVVSWVKTAWAYIEPLRTSIANAFKALGAGIKDAMSNVGGDQIMTALSTGVLAYLALTIKKWVDNVAGVGKAFSDMLEGITGSLFEMQKVLKAEALLKIAKAIALLAAALLLLSMVNPANMATGIAGLAAVMGAMIGSMKILESLETEKSTLKMIGMSIAIGLLAGAMLGFAIALKIMSTIDLQGMAVGLAGFVIVLGSVVGAIALLSKMDPGSSLIKSAFAIAILATAMLGLAFALKIFATIPIDQMLVGLLGFVITLAAVTVALMFLAANSSGVMAAAAAILAISVAMLLLAASIAIFGNMDINTLAQGLIVLGIVLAVLVGAILLLSMNNAATFAAAAALLAMAIAIGMLVGSVYLLGKMDFDSLVQGLFAVGLMMAMLALTVAGMTTALPGAAAVLIIAVALLILTVSVLAMAAVPMDALVKGLMGLIIVLGIMAIVALALAPIAPIMLALGGALALFGLGMIVLAGSAMLFVIAIAMLGPALMSVTMGFEALGTVVEQMFEVAGALAIVGPALVIFGVGATIAAIGIGLAAVAFGLFAVAMIAIGLGLTALMLVGLPAMAVIEKVVEKLADLAHYSGELAIIGLAFIVLGAGLVIFGAGALLAGIGLTVLALGFVVFSAAVMVGSAALQMLAAAMLRFLPMIPIMLAVGAGIMAAGVMAIAGAAGFAVLSVAMLALGVAVVILGVGLNIVGVGLMMVAAGLAMVGGAAMMASVGLMLLGAAVMRLVPLVAGVLALTVAFAGLALGAAALGLAAGLAAVGVGVLGIAMALLGAAVLVVGAGMMMTGLGMIMIGTSAESAAAGLQIMVGALAGLIFKIPMMVAVGAAFAALGAQAALGAVGIGVAVVATLALGAATAVAGAAMLILGLGLKTVAMGSILVGSTARMGAQGLMVLLAAVQRVAPMIPQTAALSIALIKLGVSATTAGAGATVGASGLIVLANGANTATGAIQKMGSQTANAIPKAVTAINKLKPAFEKASSSAKTSMSSMSSAISSAIPGIIASFNRMVSGIQSTVVSGVSRTTGAASSSAHSVGTAITQGMASGIYGGSYLVDSAARTVAASALAAAKSELGVKSPSKAFEKVGKFAVQGFAKGLRGDKSAVKAAYDTMKQNLKDLVASTTKDVSNAQKKLNKLTSARNKNTKAINAARKALAKARYERKRAGYAQDWHLQRLNTEEKKLEKLADRRDKTNEKLKEETKLLEDAIKTRDDYNKSITEQFSKTKEIEKDTTFADYSKELQRQIEEIRVFSTKVQELRSRGLDDTLYKKILAKGPDSLPFIDDVLNAGFAGVEELNYLNKELDTVSSALGTRAASNLYQAGVNAAQGIVDGLQNQSDNISKEMDKIADKMVKAIKSKLGIKSPSKVFAKVGRQTAEGLAKGLMQSSKAVENAAEGIGDTALMALEKTMSGLQSSMYLDMDMTPTIRPVLDLTDIRKDASLLGGILGTPKLETERAYQSALASRPTRANTNDELREQMSALLGKTEQGEKMTFNQYNNSPKALSSAEIYRQTKNQLSVVKGGLT